MDKKNYFRFIFLVLLLTSCSSIDRTFLREKSFHMFDSAPLAGMIYSLDNQPCPGVTVSLLADSGRTIVETKSDGNGRFFLPGINRGKNRIALVKGGFESVRVLFDFNDPAQIFYVRITGVRDLLSLAELSLDAYRWEDALGYLNRAAAVQPKDPEILFLSAVLARGRGDPEAAEKFLIGMLDLGITDPEIGTYLGREDKL